VAFGRRLADQGSIQADVAASRLDIDSNRLLVLKAAHVMDTHGNKVAMQSDIEPWQEWMCGGH